MPEITAVGPESSLTQLFNSTPAGTSTGTKPDGLFASLLALQLTATTPSVGLPSVVPDCEVTVPDDKATKDGAAQSVAELIAGGLLLPSQNLMPQSEPILASTPTVRGSAPLVISPAITDPLAVSDSATAIPSTVAKQESITIPAPHASGIDVPFVINDPRTPIATPAVDRLPNAVAENIEPNRIPPQPPLVAPLASEPPQHSESALPLVPPAGIADRSVIVSPPEIPIERLTTQPAESIATVIPGDRVSDPKLASEHALPPATNSLPVPVQAALLGEIPATTPGESSAPFASPRTEFNLVERKDVVAPDSRPPTDFSAAMPTPLASSDSRPIESSPRHVESPLATHVADGIVTHAKFVEHGDSHEFQIRLDPPELGEMKVRLLATGDRLQAEVTVTSDAVRGMIESQLPDLRQRLEAAGLSVSKFDVNTQAGGGSNSHHPQNPASPWELPFDGGFHGRTASLPIPPPASIVGGTLDVTA